MRQRWIWIASAVFLVARLGAAESTGAPASRVGYALLDQYVTAFREMAERGSVIPDLESRLKAMAAEAKKAKDAGEIDLVFQRRYARVLALTKLLVMPDQGNILMPVIDREVTDFLHDVTGEDPKIQEAGGPRYVGQLANALAEELVNLQIYLDTLDRRAGIRKKLEESISGPKK